MTELKTNTSSEAATSAVVKTDSRSPIIYGLLMLLFVGGGGWLHAANLSGSVIAQGAVAVPGKPKTVQHLDGGIVARIMVSDGDFVKQGETLISLDQTMLNASLQIYRNRLREAVARRARLLAERDDLDAINWDDDILDVLEVEQDEAIRQGHQKLFVARRSSKKGQIDQLVEKIAQFENQTSGVRALQTSKTKQIKMLGNELAKISALKAKGLVTNAQVLSLERQKESLNGQIGEHDAEIARIANSVNEANIQILQIERQARQSVLTELRDVEQEVNNMTQQLYATIEQLRRVDIKAPVNGLVHELNVFTIGGVIGAGAPIMQIIPQDEQFVVEANVEPQYIDELYPSQPATLRFSAFNQRSTPEINGTVRAISPAIVIDDLTGKSYYKVKLGVSDAELARLGKKKLIPGMPVEAFIKTEQRTALNYLVKPLSDQANRAFREE